MKWMKKKTKMKMKKKEEQIFSCREQEVNWRGYDLQPEPFQKLDKNMASPSDANFIHLLYQEPSSQRS